MRKIVEAKSGTKDLNQANILGVKVDSSRMDGVIMEINSKIQDTRHKGLINRPFFVVTVNPEFVMAARKDLEFKEILNSADLSIADGGGLRLVNPELDVIPGRKVVEQLLGSCKTFYLGGRDGVAREMAEKFGGEWDEGEKSIRVGELESLRILSKINKYKPDLLLVAYGAPWQEKWIYHNLDKLQAKVVMGVGGTFDYLTGRSKLPPKWMEKLGMEWLWRLIREPSRWRRQVKLVEYLWLVVTRG